MGVGIFYIINFIWDYLDLLLFVFFVSFYGIDREKTIIIK